MKENIICIIGGFIGVIAISFWLGVNYGYKNQPCSDDLRQAQQEITYLQTKNSSQEWYIADEKRKNAAFLEYIEEMEK